MFVCCGLWIVGRTAELTMQNENVEDELGPLDDRRQELLTLSDVFFRLGAHSGALCTFSANQDKDDEQEKAQESPPTNVHTRISHFRCNYLSKNCFLVRIRLCTLVDNYQHRFLVASAQAT